MPNAWTQKQREIYDLLTKGMSFSQVIEQGYAKATVSKVKKAIDSGEKPPEPNAQTQTSGSVPMAAVKTPPAGITVFRFGPDEVQMNPEDLRQSYDQYRDMQTYLGWESDFPSTLREGIKLLRTVMAHFAPNENKEEEDGNR